MSSEAANNITIRSTFSHASLAAAVTLVDNRVSVVDQIWNYVFLYRCATSITAVRLISRLKSREFARSAMVQARPMALFTLVSHVVDGVQRFRNTCWPLVSSSR